MRAVLQDKAGGADQLYIGEAEKPVPNEDELLVRVAVSALNRADLLQREGKYPPPEGASSIPGLELAGILEAKGAKATGWKTGERVFGLVPGGAHAEWAVIHKDMALRVPDAMTFEQCAAIPEVFLTAFQSLVWLSKVKRGEKVLLHAGASGVGTAAIQLASCLGVEAFVTASASKHASCLALGASGAVDYKRKDCWEVLQGMTGGVDVIVDPVGGSYFSENLRLLNSDGRLVALAVMGGAKAGDVNIGHIVFKRLRIYGSTLRSRPLSYQSKLTHDFWDQNKARFEEGNLIPVIDRVFDLDRIADAHLYLESNRSIGKVLLKIG